MRQVSEGCANLKCNITWWCGGYIGRFLPYSEWLNRVWRVWFFIRRERLPVLYFAFGFSLLLHGDKLWPMNYLIKGRHGTSLWTRKTYWLKNIWTQHTQVLWYQYFSPMYIVWFATDINQKSHLPQSSTIRNNWILHPEGLGSFFAISQERIL